MSSGSLLFAHASTVALICVLIHGVLSFHTIEKALAFYGVYHQHPINQIIHFFGVPCITWSVFVFLAHIQLPFIIPIGGHGCDTNRWKIDIPGAPSHNVNYATLVCLGYVTFYLYIDRFGGLLYAPFGYLLYATAISFTMSDQQKYLEEARQSSIVEINATTRKNAVEKTQDGFEKVVVPWTGTGKALKIAFLLHITGWYVQIHPGHRVFEGGAPALMQSLGGALTSAPLFAYYEGLWALGLNESLRQTTLELVSIYTKELCASGEITSWVCEEAL